MTFARRHIDVIFELGTGNFGDGASDRVTLSGLRVEASITKVGGLSSNTCECRIYGMTLSDMNKLSTLGKPLQDGRNNTIRVLAGDDDSGMSVAFVGIINQAWTDIQGAPEVPFTVQATTGFLDAMKPIPATSYKGSADVADIIAGLAVSAGRQFENNGVSVQLNNPYFPGTALQQAQTAAQHARIDFINDDDTWVITKRGAPRGTEAILVNQDTGMIGSPAWTASGIIIRTLYNPTIFYKTNVKVESIFEPANGTWVVYSLRHDLESETDGGAWFTEMQGSVFGHELPLS